VNAGTGPRVGRAWGRPGRKPKGPSGRSRARPKRPLRCASIAGALACVSRASPGWPRPSTCRFCSGRGYKGVSPRCWPNSSNAWPLRLLATQPATGRPNLLLEVGAPRLRGGISRAWPIHPWQPQLRRRSLRPTEHRTLRKSPGRQLVGLVAAGPIWLEARVFQVVGAIPAASGGQNAGSNRGLELRRPLDERVRRLVAVVTAARRRRPASHDPNRPRLDRSGPVGPGRRLRPDDGPPPAARCWTITTVVTITKPPTTAMLAESLI